MSAAPRRTFAEDSSVPVDRTRAEINKLLTEWNCGGYSWTDNLAERRVALGFFWMKNDPEHGPATYKVRILLEVPARHPPDPKRSWVKPELLTSDETAQRWRSAHRLLLLKLKADLNSVHAGLLKSEEVFLPWMVGADGQTVSEVVLPRLAQAYAQLPAKAGS